MKRRLGTESANRAAAEPRRSALARRRESGVMTTGRGAERRDVSSPRSPLPPPPPELRGHWSGCGHRRGIPQDVPATESHDHHPKHKRHYECSNRRDRHSPPSACLNLPHHLVHRWVVFHESKRCIDCADAMNQGAARQARADSTRPVPSGPFRRPSFVLAVVEAVQGCRLGACAGARTAALSLPDHCLWVTVPPQAHLISIGSTKAMDDIIQFEGAASYRTWTPSVAEWRAQLRSRRYRLGEAVIAAMSNVAPTMQKAYRDTK